MRMRAFLALGLVVLVVAGVMLEEATACRIIPTPMPIVRPPRPWPRPRPVRRALETRSHKADITIKGPVAKVDVDAVFYNPNPYVLEGTYFFPLAANAAVKRVGWRGNPKLTRSPD